MDTKLETDDQHPRTVKLNKEEIQWVKDHALEVEIDCTTNIKNRVTHKIGKESEVFYKEIGYAAELAFVKASGSIGDFSISVRKQGKDGTMLNGVTYDVKSTHHKYGRLNAPKANKAADIFVFCIVDRNLAAVRIYGYVWHEELCRKENWEAFQGRPGYWLDRDSLHRFKGYKDKIYGLEEGDPNVPKEM